MRNNALYDFFVFLSICISLFEIPITYLTGLGLPICTRTFGQSIISFTALWKVTCMEVISCFTWVPPGFAAEKPLKIQLSNKDLAQIYEDEIEDQNDNENIENESDLEELYHLNDYDDATNSKDKSLKLSDICQLQNYKNISSDDEDLEDWLIKPNDYLIPCGVIDEVGQGVVEIYVYNEVEDSFYVHHDISLDSIPLSCEWLSLPSLGKTTNQEFKSEIENNEKDAKNLLAIGLKSCSYIGVWDLDVDGALEPILKLRFVGQDDKRVKRDITCMSWNRFVGGHKMASGGADGIVSLWDLNEGKQLGTQLHIHKAKINSLEWHPSESHLLLSSASDGQIVVLDGRQATEENVTLKDACKKIELKNEDIEGAYWNPHESFQIIAGTNSGYIHIYDCRNLKKSLFTINTLSSDIISNNANNIDINSETRTTGKKKRKVEKEAPLDFETFAFDLCYPALITSHSKEFCIKLWDVSKFDGSTQVSPKPVKVVKSLVRNIHTLKFAVQTDDNSNNNNKINNTLLKSSYTLAYAGFSKKPFVKTIKLMQ